MKTLKELNEYNDALEEAEEDIDRIWAELTQKYIADKDLLGIDETLITKPTIESLGIKIE